VKVVWSREDDIKFDVYHSVAAMYMKAALGADGTPTAWLQRTVFPPIGSTFNASENHSDPGELGLGFTDVPFAVANLRAENGPATTHTRIGWFRSVANIYHASEFIRLRMNWRMRPGEIRWNTCCNCSDRTASCRERSFQRIFRITAQNTSSIRSILEISPCADAGCGKGGLGKAEAGQRLRNWCGNASQLLTYVATVCKCKWIMRARRTSNAWIRPWMQVPS